MTELKCTCGRRWEYDVLSGKFREVITAEDVILKIRCSIETKERFKQLKGELELPSYESLLQMLMAMRKL